MILGVLRTTEQVEHLPCFEESPNNFHEGWGGGYDAHPMGWGVGDESGGRGRVMGQDKHAAYGSHTWEKESGDWNNAQELVKTGT